MVDLNYLRHLVWARTTRIFNQTTYMVQFIQVKCLCFKREIDRMMNTSFSILNEMTRKSLFYQITKCTLQEFGRNLFHSKWFSNQKVHVHSQNMRERLRLVKPLEGSFSSPAGTIPLQPIVH